MGRACDTTVQSERGSCRWPRRDPICCSILHPPAYRIDEVESKTSQSEEVVAVSCMAEEVKMACDAVASPGMTARLAGPGICFESVEWRS